MDNNKEYHPDKCEKPYCDCLDIAEDKNGGNPVKSYPCLAKCQDIEALKSTPAAPSSVDDMAKIEQDANIEDVANSIAEDMYPYPSHMKYAFGGKGLVDADRFKIVKGFKLGAQWQKQRDADTIAQLQATNLELSKRVFELEKELDEQTLSFMDWMLLNSYEYSYTNKGWQNDFPDGMDPNSEEPTYHTTEQLLQIYKQSKINN